MVRDVVEALSGLHALAYVHRDVKPHDVLLCKDPETGCVVYKLCDFGMAESADREIENDGDGTPGYMPSEKFLSRSSDTFALGRLVLACRSGKEPMSGSVEQLRTSGVYDHLLDMEWELFKLCLIEHGSDRPWPARLRKYTKYFMPM